MGPRLLPAPVHGTGRERWEVAENDCLTTCQGVHSSGREISWKENAAGVEYRDPVCYTDQTGFPLRSAAGTDKKAGRISGLLDGVSRLHCA
jgi:hypothetical protein